MKQVLMIPLPAYGHIIPLLELAKKLTPFHRVIFVVPQYMIEDVRSRNLLTENDQLRLCAVQDGYPQNHAFGKTSIQNTLYLMAFYVPKLLDLSASLKNNSEIPTGLPKNESSLKIDLLIVDQFLSMVAVSCYDKDIPVFYYNTSSAGGMHLKGLLIENNCPIKLDAEASLTIWEKSGSQPLNFYEKLIFQQMQKNFPKAKALIVNSYRDLEVETLQQINQMPAMAGKKVFMVGPLLPAQTTKAQHITEWMDGKENHSVVYVSFGTIMAPPAEQIAEIAKALLSAQRPFIWSLSADGHECLPEEIKRRMKHQPESADSTFLILTWAPQAQILAHPAAGLFFSHCGWNSSLEALSNGVPVLGWPMFADQGINAQLLTEIGVGLVVEGTGMKAKRFVPAEDIAQLISDILSSPVYRKNATEWANTQRAAIQSGGSSDKDLNELIEFI